MNRTLFWFSFTASTRSLLIWTGVFFVYGVFLASLYEAMAAELESLGNVFSSLPEQVLIMVGQESGDVINMWGSVEAFTATEYLSWWPVMVGIYSLFAMSRTVAGEREDGTLELLLAQPITRREVVVSKFVAFVAILALMALVTVLALEAGYSLQGYSVNVVRTAVAVGEGFLLVTFIAAYSLFFSCCFGETRYPLALAGGLTASLYLLNIFEPTLGVFGWLSALSPFHYYRVLSVLENGTVSWVGIGYWVFGVLICLGAAVVIFQRKDVP